MSLLSITASADAALPALQVFAVQVLMMARLVARLVAGLGVLAVLLYLFRPLLVGMLRAAVLVVRPRVVAEQDTLRRNMKAAAQMNRIAQDIDSTHPSLAAELRFIAARG